MAAPRKQTPSTGDSAEELLKHKLFFGSKEFFDDPELRFELNKFGPVVDYTRHKDKNCGYVTFYDAKTAQKLVGTVITLEDYVEVEMKAYTPQASHLESDLAAIKTSRAKWSKQHPHVATSPAPKVAVTPSAVKSKPAVLPGAAKSFAWASIVAPPSPNLLGADSDDLPTLGSNHTSSKSPHADAPIAKPTAAAPKAQAPVQKVIKRPAEAKPAEAKKAPLRPPTAPKGLVGGVQVDVTVKNDDVPSQLAVDSQLSISLRVHNETNSSKTLETVTIDGKWASNARITSGVAAGSKTTPIGPQQSHPIAILVTTPSQPCMMAFSFIFKFSHKVIHHKLLVAVIEKLPERPIVAAPLIQYQPDLRVRKRVGLPAFRSIHPVKHIPHFEEPEKVYPLTENTKTRLEALKDDPVPSPAWSDRNTYKQKMHDLLWMEEMEEQRLLRQFDLSRTIMSIYNEPMCRDPLLSMEVPSLSEKRPSIMAGDHLFAWIEGNTDVEYEGYIYRVKQALVVASFAPEFHEKVWRPGVHFTVRFTTSRQTFLVQHKAIDAVDLDVIYPDASLAPLKAEPKIDIATKDLADSNVANNANQLKAIQLGLNRRISEKNVPLLVFGPFGTGKTKTLVELIYQAFRTKPTHRILVCALSNSAADVITQRLIAIPAVGSSATASTNLLRLYAHTRKVGQFPSEIMPFTYFDQEKMEFGVPSHLKQIRIVVCTCNNASSLQEFKHHFTHIIIDEAAQVKEAEALMPLSLANRTTSIIMAGDPKQLQYKPQSNAPALAVLGLSIMDRLSQLPDYSQVTATGAVKTNALNYIHLNDNYRSHPAILQFASDQFYGGSLKSKVDVNQLPPLSSWSILNSETASPLAFLPIEGTEQCEDDSPSFFNIREAQTVTLLVQNLLQDDVVGKYLKQNEVGVITPFFKQTKKIRDMLRQVGYPDVTVSSVADLQGKEYKALFVSTVRTSKRYLERDSVQAAGFINSPNALNTVVTRSRALLVVVGDPFTVAQDDSWNAYMQACLDSGNYIGETMSAQRVAEREAEEEIALRQSTPLVTLASDAFIDVDTITYSKARESLEEDTADPYSYDHENVADHFDPIMDTHLHGFGAMAYDPLRGMSGNPSELARSAPSSTKAPSKDVRASLHSEAAKAPSYHPSQENRLPQAPQQQAMAAPSQSTTLLVMDGQHEFLVKSPEYDAPNTLVVMNEATQQQGPTIELQIAILGFMPHIQRQDDQIVVALDPLRPEQHSALRWTSIARRQMLRVILIPTLDIRHVEYLVSQSMLRIICHRGAHITPQQVPDHFHRQIVN